MDTLGDCREGGAGNNGGRALHPALRTGVAPIRVGVRLFSHRSFYMLRVSKSNAYVKNLNRAIADDKTLFPLAGPLGLSPETAMAGLESLHSVMVASGSERVGRKLIHSKPASHDAEHETPCFGYLYEHVLAHCTDGVVEIEAPQNNPIRVAPVLVVRVSGSPTAQSSYEQFVDVCDAVAMGLEILAIPFANDHWTDEDVICANGFNFKLALGEMKGLSRASRRNFDDIIAHSCFGFSCIERAGAQLRGFCAGSRSFSTSLRQLYQACQRYQRDTGEFPISEGDLVVFQPLCEPMAGSTGEEWVCSSAGILLEELRVRFMAKTPTRKVQRKLAACFADDIGQRRTV